MIRLFSTVLIISTIFNNLYSQWEILNEGRREGLVTVDFINEISGWRAGNNALLKTDDGGKTWNNIDLEIDFSVSDIDFINEHVGWAIESSDLLKTEDGGRNWVVILSDNSGISFKDIHVINDSVTYAVGYDGNYYGYIYKTVDGGINWQAKAPFSEDLQRRRHKSVCFFNNDTGIVSGAYITVVEGDKLIPKANILRTFDGGNTWEEEIAPGYEQISNLQFLNKNNSADYIGYFLADGRYLCVTNDTCSTWSVIAENVRSYYCLDDRTIVAIIDDDTSTYVMKTNDGGLTWINQQPIWFSDAGFIDSPITNPVIYFLNDHIGYILGGDILYKTIDGGENWMYESLVFSFFDVHFIDQNTGFACSGGGLGSAIGSHGGGSFGVVFVTHDGGATWRYNLNSSPIINTLFFVNDSVGYLTHIFSGRLLKTINQGNKWLDLYVNNPDPSFSLNTKDLFFLDDMNGWIVGSFWTNDSSGAAILSTNDGGENWKIVWQYPDTDDYRHQLNAIHARGNEAWVIGENGLIAKFTEQDQWQAVTDVTDLPLSDVFFSDQDRGWIAGGYYDWQSHESHLILLRTINGGKTWEQIQDTNYRINDMFFEDSLHGWAVGNDTSGHGMILETLDSGVNWTALIADLSAPLNTLHFKNGFGWAVGGNGLVLRTDDGVIWIDQNTGEANPSEYKLSQNYPNPFNSSTTIEFTLPKSEFVTLRVYNLLGQKVKILVSDKLASGLHRYTWNGSNYASGIYWYRLETENGFVKSRKLVLLK